MPFNKLHPDIQEKLVDLEIETPTPLQSKSIPVIKSGANVYCIGPKGSGKTTTLILTTLHKLKCKSVGQQPRAIVIVEDKQRALDLHDAFISHLKYSAMRVYASYEQLHIDVQKSEIFMGVDILISTPKALNKLFLANSLSTSEIKIVSIDDAEFLYQQSAYAALLSAEQFIKKSQFVVYAEEITPKIKRFESFFMEYSKKVSV